MNSESRRAAGDSTPQPQRHLLDALFISPAEPRLRAGWRLVLQIVMQLLLTACVALAVVAGWRGAFTDGSSSLSGNQILLPEIGEMFAITISIFLARRFLDRRSFSSLGLRLRRRALRDFAAGLVIACVMMGTVFFAELAFGWLEVTGLAWQTQGAAEVGKNSSLFLLICAIVGWNEELMSRGYHLQTLASGLGERWGWLLSSLAFAMLHLANPHANAMAVAGIFLAGLFLGYGFIRSRQLWLPIGLHVGWNFFEGVVFGFPVSGLTFYRLPQTIVRGPALWTGGEFGPEAGVLLIPALAIGFVLVHATTRGRPSA